MGVEGMDERSVDQEAGVDRTAGLAVSTSVEGALGNEAIDYAIGKVQAVARSIDDPVRGVEIRLVRAPDPARARPVRAEATIDVDGQPIRAHVAATTATEAADLLQERLRRRVERLRNKRQAARRRLRAQDEHAEGEWRHGDLPEHRPPWFDRPRDERDLVRRKSFAPAPMGLLEAIDQLDLLAHDFFLFEEEHTGAPAVVAYRDDGPGVTIQLDSDEPLEEAAYVESIDRLARPPQLLLRDARRLLEARDVRHLFFVDLTSKAPMVVYRRYDGHDGLVVLDTV